MDFKVLSGSDVNLLITHHFDHLNGWTAIPGTIEGEYIAKPSPAAWSQANLKQAQFRIVVNSFNSDYKACGDEALYTDQKVMGTFYSFLMWDKHRSSA